MLIHARSPDQDHSCYIGRCYDESLNLRKDDHLKGKLQDLEIVHSNIFHITMYFPLTTSKLRSYLQYVPLILPTVKHWCVCLLDVPPVRAGSFGISTGHFLSDSLFPLFIICLLMYLFSECCFC
jgi:hypothetical protein